MQTKTCKWWKPNWSIMKKKKPIKYAEEGEMGTF